MDSEKLYETKSDTISILKGNLDVQTCKSYLKSKVKLALF